MNQLTSLQAFRRLYEQVDLGWVYAITKYEPLSFFVLSDFSFTRSSIEMLPSCRHTGFWLMLTSLLSLCVLTITK